MSVTKFANYSWAHELGIWYCNFCCASEATPDMINHDLGCRLGCLDVSGMPFSKTAEERLARRGTE